MRRGEGEAHRELLWRNLRKRGHWDVLGLDVDIIVKRIVSKWNGGLDWFELSHDSDSCWAFVNVVMKLRVA